MGKTGEILKEIEWRKAISLDFSFTSIWFGISRDGNLNDKKSHQSILGYKWLSIIFT